MPKNISGLDMKNISDFTIESEWSDISVVIPLRYIMSLELEAVVNAEYKFAFDHIAEDLKLDDMSNSKHLIRSMKMYIDEDIVGIDIIHAICQCVADGDVYIYCIINNVQYEFALRHIQISRLPNGELKRKYGITYIEAVVNHMSVLGGNKHD